MARYLLVLYDVDDGDGLLAAARDLSSEDPRAEFVLITPASAPAFDLFLEPRCSPTRLAARRAWKVQDQLVAAGVNLVASRLGNFDPFRALEDALRFSEYAAVVVATPEHNLLHLIHCDLTCRMARRFRGAHLIHAFRASQAKHSRLELEPGSVTRSVQH